LVLSNNDIVSFCLTFSSLVFESVEIKLIWMASFKILQVVSFVKFWNGITAIEIFSPDEPSLSNEFLLKIFGQAITAAIISIARIVTPACSLRLINLTDFFFPFSFFPLSTSPNSSLRRDFSLPIAQVPSAFPGKSLLLQELPCLSDYGIWWHLNSSFPYLLG